MSFQVSSIHRPPSREEKTARTLRGFEHPFGGTIAIQVGGPCHGSGAGQQNHAHGQIDIRPAGHVQAPVAQAGGAVDAEHSQGNRPLVQCPDADLGFGGQEIQAFPLASNR